jgi:hypothetical protein
MMSTHTSCPRHLAIPGVAFPRTVTAGRDVLDRRECSDWAWPDWAANIDEADARPGARHAWLTRIGHLLAGWR